MTSFIEFSDSTVFDAFGFAGFALYVLNYMTLTLRWVDADSIRYFATNLMAAGLVLVGLTSAFNLASALIQIFFILSSAVAILIRLRARSMTKTQLEY
ncbi:hypothetical protein BC777_1441 [Yoonia maricola]|uniref:CBU-0592-like domain-containing protein n=1 Tax=Yoonia maricola TaxID=420999 RepID=A0A2M8WNY3_9RHOB|nr:hypothetical protein [Yoonia maricola]PJI92586.1 hypothetical protein BC777_1441 [Yoonia maricola]